MSFRARLALFGYPALELLTMYVLAQYIGWGWTLIAVLAGLPIGIIVMRWAARRGDAIAFFGGILFAIPGLWSDLAGLLMLLPWTQRPLRERSETWIRARVVTMNFPGAEFPRDGFHGDVVQGTVISSEEDEGPPTSGERPSVER